MEIDYDIYDNLPKDDINTYDEIEKLQEQNKQQLEFINSLQDDIEKLCANIVNMKQTQKQLKCNISELYKTAKTEIDRKDRLIADLRSQLEKLQSERRTDSLKRERSPYSQRISIDPLNKKLKQNHIYDINSSGSRSTSRSHSRDRYQKSDRNRSREKGRQGTERHTNEQKVIRDHNNYKKEWIMNDKKTGEKSKEQEASKQRRYDINGENKNKLFVYENVNSGNDQEKNVTNKSLIHCDMKIKKNINESKKEKENEVRPSIISKPNNGKVVTIKI